MATLSAAIMAHPKRADMVAELQTWLDRPVEVVWDKINDRYDTGARAMAAFDPAATHHLVIQDDVVPCRDLLAGAERALKWCPDDVPVSLYVGRVRPFSHAVEHAVEVAGDHSSWIVMDGVYWGPAIILPTKCIPNIVNWFSRTTVQNYDGRISRWFESRKTQCWYTWPSLVDHRGDASLAHPRSKPGRRTHSFLGADQSALSVEWDGSIVTIDNTASLNAERQRRARKSSKRVRR
jgi:hypothetical protein